MKPNFPRFGALFSLTLVAFLAACSSTGRAPVEDRVPSTRSSAQTQTPSAESAPAVAKPGYYIVKRGDTLISIALEHGQDWRDIANWNSIENPNLILVGQELRVKPVDGLTPKGVTAPAVEVKPIDAKNGVGTTASAVKADETLRRDPKGGKVAYSDQALAAAVKADEAARAAKGVGAAAVAAPVETKPADTAKKDAVADARSASTEPKGDDDFDWTWPASGKILSGFNDATNKGVDIGGQIGEPVVAAATGKIVYVGSGLRGYGNLVIIKHNATFLSAYAHNQKILVKEGQSVKKGQEIAALGDSDADRAKLHFEIRRQGKPVDPLKYLPKR
ncbi:peptidoglycan DD-metalloendopeptidase family protein [Niveibacterium umoris]|uniref:Lipoprotein NlpD n=1 Tax=Niveibacterium umoris TaxID=1193620 RepID=A0A840BI38_9RHOO|nr:peptidoglycan DD-metalloendopeptidase family protein [Niveibacterium umoris]MBB4011974.1 lipoprotein NlpD [Niveibacterium umoris]